MRKRLFILLFLLIMVPPCERTWANDISTIMGTDIDGVASICGVAKASIASFGGGGVPAEAGGCNDTTKDESPGGDLSDGWIGDTDQLYIAGSFAAGSSYLVCEVDLRVYRDGTCSRTLAAQIYACDAGGEETGKPTGAALATSDEIDISGLGGSYITLTFTFASPLSLTSGTRYWIAARLSGTCGGNNIAIESDGNGAQTGRYISGDGSTWSTGGTWSTLVFETRD